MNIYKFETDLVLKFENTIVAENEKDAEQRMKKVFIDAIEDGSILKFSTSTSDIAKLKSVKEVPNHFSNSHNTLLEMGYPIEMIKNYSEEDAEEEISAAVSSQ